MSSAAPFPKRYRRKFSRRRDGCLSCRSRRKKCDGQKPGCGYCLQNSLDCHWPLLEGSLETGKTSDVVISNCSTDCYLHPTSGSHRHGSLHDDPRIELQALCFKSDHDIAGANYPHISILTIASAAANRKQLFNTFLGTHIPSNVLPQEREDSVYLMYFGFLEELTRTQCDHPVLSTAMGALSLVSVGSMIRDPEMLRKSSEEYSISVNRLANAVRRPDSVQDDVLLAAIMVLATCEFYEPFSKKSQAQGYYSHIVGLHSLLATRGPQRPKSRLISLILAKAKASSITKSMFSHRTDFYAEPAWRQLGLNVPSLDEDRCYDLGIRMSQLFSSSDHLDLDHPGSLQEIDDLLRDGACLERDLTNNHDHHVAALWTSTAPSVTLESIERFPRYCELVADRTLSTAHRFPSYTMAYLYNSYWMRMAMLRTVVQTLQSKRSLLSTDDLPTYADGYGHPVTASELRHYVISVCRNLPFFAEPACASAGDVCSFLPLHWASEYFSKCKDARWCAWVEDVRLNFSVRGVSFPALNRLKTPEIMEIGLK